MPSFLQITLMKRRPRKSFQGEFDANLATVPYVIGHFETQNEPVILCEHENQA